MTESSLGLRERKRLATKRTIQRAVLSLSAEHGFEHVTIEDVSREADIAPRTFFNYFPTKEAALMGDLPLEPSAESIQRFSAGGPSGHFFTDFGELVAEQLDTVTPDREIQHLRHCVFKDNPALAKMQFESKRGMQDQLVTLIHNRILLDHPGASEADAQLLSAICIGVIRSAWMRWAHGADERSIGALMRESFADVYRVVSDYR